MRSLVVYDSWFGNTRRVAEEIAGGLAQAGEVEVVSVDEPLPPLADVDLLVVGAPTHVHGLSGRHSREAALEQGGHGEAGTGVRGWIAGLPNGARGPRAAAFDTRADKPALLVGQQRAASPGDCVSTDMRSLPSPRASSSRARPGRSRRASSNAPPSGGGSW